MATNRRRVCRIMDRTHGEPIAVRHFAWVWCLAVASGACVSIANAQTPLSSAFTYQGQLRIQGQPLGGTADFEFTLWDADIDGNMTSDPIAVHAQSVVDGQFTTQLNASGS